MDKERGKHCNFSLYTLWAIEKKKQWPDSDICKVKESGCRRLKKKKKVIKDNTKDIILQDRRKAI